MTVLLFDKVIQAPAAPGQVNESRSTDTPVRQVVRLRDGDNTIDLAYPERNCAPAYVNEYRKDRKRGIRNFTLWQDQARSRPLAVVTTQPGATKQCAEYLVSRPTGEVIGTVGVNRATLSTPHRTRWTIRQNGQVAVGIKGHIVWWVVWWLLFPLQAIGFVVLLLGNNGDLVRPPLRTVWRMNGSTVLDYQNVARDFYSLPTRWMDQTMAAAVVALHQSHVPLTDPAWDDEAPPRKK